MTARLYLLGLGLEPEQHATVETLQAAAQCEVVFWTGADAGARLLGRFCKDVRRGASADAVFAELEAGRVVAWATPAHPVVYDGTAAVLAARCEKASIAWETFGAVSSAGVALAASGLTLGEDIFGVQAFDAAAAASGAARLNPAIPAVLHFYAPAPEMPALSAALQKLYPADHKVSWCASTGIVGSTTVAGLAKAAPPAPSSVLLLEAPAGATNPWGKAFEFRDRAEAAAATDHKRAPAWVKME